MYVIRNSLNIITNVIVPRFDNSNYVKYLPAGHL